MSSRPGSSLRARLISPPPSKALLALQKQGLELAVSPPPDYLQVAPRPSSGRSTPSDLDKPLPLEPFDDRRRPSSEYSVDRGSVYSTDTTITNILRMYGEYRDLDDIPPIPMLHQPQAYRDTVAPLLITRLSLSPSRSPQPVLKDAPREAVSSSSLRSSIVQHNIPSNKTAPSFAEFSRQLQQRRDQLVSPLSDLSAADSHRQAAYDQLASPSPQVSSVGHSISVSQTPPLPDAMSVTISDLDESDLLPPPLGMSSSSLPSPPYDDWEKPAEFNPARHDDQYQSQPGHHGHTKSWSHNWLDDGFVNQSPDSSPTDRRVRDSFRPRSPIPLEERERVISYAEAKYPGMKRNSSEKKARTSSARSSVQQGVGNLLRSLSRKSATGNKDWAAADNKAPTERQLAIPATPYQVYGAEVFTGKLQKKQQKAAEREAQQAQQEAQRARRQRGKSISLTSVYHNGQNGLVAGLRKLTGKGSQKRQKQLKNSIMLVVPTGVPGVVERQFAVGREETWI